MKTVRYGAVLALATLVVAGFGGAASAQTSEISSEHPLGEHPAILVKRQPPAVDTNRLIFMHPAQLMVINTPTPTDDHPPIAAGALRRDAPTVLGQASVESADRNGRTRP